MKQIKPKLKWDLDLIISAERRKNFDAEVKKISAKISSFAKKWKGTDEYLKSPTKLAEALANYEEIFADQGIDGDIGYYYWLKSTLDQNNSQIKSKLNILHSHYIENANLIQFFEIEIGNIPKELQSNFLSSPALKNYKHYLEKIFKQAPHILSDDQEKIFNFLAKPAKYNWVNMVESLISKEEEEVITKKGKQKKHFSDLLGLINNEDKKIRDSAAKAFNKILDKYKEIAEHEFNAVLEYKFNSDKIRNYTRPDSARHLSDDVSDSVVDTMLSVVHKNFQVAQDYYKLKAKLMKVKKMQYHERNLELMETKQRYKYADAANMLVSALAEVDVESAELAQKYISQGYIDVKSKKGKRNGAFASYGNFKNSTFILLNYKADSNGVLTLAHEVGHGIQFDLTRKNVTPLNFTFPMCTAETSSTFFEDVMMHKLLENAPDSEKLALLMIKLNDEISTIFRQVAFYRFEQEIHTEFRKTGYLSYKQIGKIFQKHMESYMGPAVEQSDGSENWWLYVNHFRSYFYVYSYAFGALISKALLTEVRENPKNFEKVKTFLSGGGEASPEELLKTAGLDISKPQLWQEGIDSIKENLKLAEKLAEKVL